MEGKREMQHARCYVKRWTMTVAAMAAFGMAAAAAGDELARWNSENLDGGKASYAPTAVKEGLAAADVKRGAGLKAGSGTGTFAASGYDVGTATFDKAMSGNDYWETCLTPSGGLMTLDLLTYGFGRSKTGPTSWQWAAKVGASGSWTALGVPVTVEASDTEYKTYSVGLDALPPTDQPVYFRLVAWGASNAGGTGNFGKATDVLLFEGSLQRLDGPPVVRFTPASASVDVSNTLEIAVSVLPAGSEITSWSCNPSPAGTPTLSGGVFRYTALNKDATNWFTVTVTAANDKGSTTASGTFFVNKAAPAGTLTLTFDNEQQTSWSGSGSVTIPAGSGLTWSMKYCMIGEDAAAEGGDQVYSKVGRALRFAFDESGSFESKSKIVALSKAGDTVETNGVAQISFWYGVFKGDAGEESEHPVRPAIVTELSDDGKLWVEVGRAATEGTEEDMAEAVYEVGVETPVYLRIRTEGVTGSSRVNVDQLRVVPKTTDKSVLNEYLRQYNVTPGDAQTGRMDDWDGDGSRNYKERDNGTNPYDKNDK